MYGEGILDRLPEHSPLHDVGNDFRNVFINTVGALLDDFDVNESREGVYLQSANSVYLDMQGKDYNVKRRLDESDDDYRTRLIYETLGCVSVDYLVNVYNCEVYTFVEDFDATENIMVSDNHYIHTDGLIISGNSDAQDNLNSKFIVGENIYWLNENGSLDYVMKDTINIINEYPKLYKSNNISQLFKNNTLITKIKINADNVVKCLELCRNCTGLLDAVIEFDNVSDCRTMFHTCTGLTGVNLDLPSATDVRNILRGCTSLTDVVMNLPSLNDFTNMFYGCTALENITLTIPVDKVNEVKSYISGLSLANLDTLIINGEEVEL